MHTFQCTGCGYQVQQPTQPYTCPQCGRQAIGLFRIAPAAGAQGAPATPTGMPPMQPGMPPQKPGMPPQRPQQPGLTPPTPGSYPTQPGVPASHPGMPPAQPGLPPAQPTQPAQFGPIPGQPGMPPSQQGGPPAQQGVAPGQYPTMPAAPGVPPSQYGAVPPQPGLPPSGQAPSPPQPPYAPQPPAVPPTPQAPAPPSQPPAPQVPTQPLPPQQPPAPLQQAPMPPQQPAPQAPEPLPPQPAQPTQQAPVESELPPTPQQPQTPTPSPRTPPKTAQPAAEPQRPTQRPTSPTPPREQRPERPASAPPETSERKKPKATAPTPPRAAPKKAEPPKPIPVPKPKPKPKPRPRPKAIRPKQFVWAYPEEPPYEGESTPLRSAPAVDSTGRVFLHAHGRLVALEERDDAMKVCWEYVTSSRAPGPPVMAPDGSLRLHCSDGSLHCISFEGKQIYAPATVGEPLGWAAPIADGEGNTWISAYEGGLLKINAEGRLQKSPYFRSRQKLNSGGILHDGVLYIGSEDGCVFAIEMGDNKGKNRWDHAAGLGSTGWYIHSSPAMTDDGTLVVAGRDEHLYGFVAKGKEAWKSPMPGQLLASPVIDRHGQIYLGVSLSKRGEKPQGMLLCIDGNSHKPRWQYEAAGPVESTPAIGDDDVIYFGDNAGTIHAIDFEGKAKWTAQVESAARSATTIIGPGRVAFCLDNETLVVLRCDAKGLANEGWPKIGKTLGQCGLC